MNTESILGYPIIQDNSASCIGLLRQWVLKGKKGKYLACANPHSLAVAESDLDFHEALIHADILVPDGSGIILASRMLGGGIRERITGSDIFYGLSSEMNKLEGRSCFFLGSTEESLGKISDKFQKQYPHVRLEGTYSPPYKSAFDDVDNEQMIAAVNATSPDILWVGMSAPKQEKWIFENRARLNASVIVAIGAVFDFYIGNVKRSHPVFQKIGLEWLPRLLQEPKRLWRRTFISAPRFLIAVVKQCISRNY
ncbi:N-acetylglucosaminyldiphosphoundecaprenol N-acetyl-beta-D-mannosaminyltransferase [Mariprofundus aestuarium]|uniref:N-acetylglucosaminyldiphosphoundecaprenol N-acetyl-beta-D-mannosaminyltransferase n=1 Tax=Mariprofundus aestuarium TaxID=1921086 RepID=A0A2K8KY39_MARES|nr:WecB/TagA/CpsF family glycosyltransferase [Mariprofundus aestuarium]ATX79662.1 N-acetylglucosaminyldiphosphoundecaprenol N-acetyl-beta-D-mannosaminyltransferase [Mariprofundus aestuarium]